MTTTKGTENKSGGEWEHGTFQGLYVLLRGGQIINEILISST